MIRKRMSRNSERSDQMDLMVLTEQEQSIIIGSFLQN